MNRLDEMEHEIQERTTETEVRQLLQDKLDPLKDRIISIDAKLDHIINSYIRRK